MCKERMIQMQKLRYTKIILYFLFFLYFLCQFFRDRDELLLALQTVRASLQEAKQKEWSACLRVKQAVEVAEEANLSKARVRETY